MESPDNASVPPGRLLYLPRFDCHSGGLMGARLYADGPAGPTDFVLEALTEAGLADLREAFSQAAAWSRTSNRPVALAIDARLETLCAPAFVQTLSGILLETQLEPRSLDIGIVTHAPEISPDTLSALQHLKNCGVRFTLNAASPALARLAWVRSLPLDGLVVPSPLAQDVVDDPEGIAILRALIARAHKFKLAVCAQDVDSPRTAAVMIALGCDLIGGPLFSAPEPAAGFQSLLAADRHLDPDLLRGPQPERTLLLVDDEENILSSLRRLLRRDGYTILTATSGQRGLELMATHPVDVILSDQRMPAMTGVEFLQKAKNMNPDSVRMVLSGYTDLQSVTDAINEGDIYKFLTKPWDDAMLRANIREAFQRKLLNDENHRLSKELADANQELERINARLKHLLAERERQLGMEEAVLSLTHAALAVLPVPLLGIDPGGMIALANAAAEQLFARQAPLIGLDIADVLPPESVQKINAGEQRLDIECAGHRFHLEARPLGGDSGRADPRGMLLSFTCQKNAP